MYLHLGNKVIIPVDEIIAIFDYERIKNVKINKEYLKKASEKNIIEKVDPQGKDKTVVITKEKIYLSSISQFTIKKRFIGGTI